MPTNEVLWIRHNRDTTVIPKDMPLILSIMDDFARGSPVSSTYLGLWCKKYNEGFITIENYEEMAFDAGLVGQRAEQTWKIRMQTLSDLGFIDLKEDPAKHESYALIFDPFQVIEGLFKRGAFGLRNEKYYALIGRGN